MIILYNVNAFIPIIRIIAYFVTVLLRARPNS